MQPRLLRSSLFSNSTRRRTIRRLHVFALRKKKNDLEMRDYCLSANGTDGAVLKEVKHLTFASICKQRSVQDITKH